MDFLRKFFLEGFESGDYTYKTTHLICLTLVIVTSILVPILLRKKDEKLIRRIVRVLGIVMLVIYFTRRLLPVFFNGVNFFEALYPFYLCNILTILVGVCAIWDIKPLKNFCFVTGILGGIITFAIPDGIFCDRYLTFPILDSVTSHWGLILIPMIMFVRGLDTLEFKNIWQTFLGLVLVVINVEVLQKLLFGKYFDYLFLGEASPIQIPNVPTFLVVPTLFIIAILIVYSCFYFKNRMQHKKEVLPKELFNSEEALV